MRVLVSQKTRTRKTLRVRKKVVALGVDGRVGAGAAAGGGGGGVAEEEEEKEDESSHDAPGGSLGAAGAQHFSLSWYFNVFHLFLFVCDEINEPFVVKLRLDIAEKDPSGVAYVAISVVILLQCN